MRIVLLLSALMLAGACGGRTSLNIPPGVKLDHSVVTPDRSLPRYDGTPWPGPERGVVVPDFGVHPVPDKAKPLPDKSLPLDKSCLPLPASQIEGGYVGQWKGSFTCLPGTTVNGDLKFTLTSIGSSMLQVSGSFVGSMYGFPLSSNIGGSMSCTTFGGSLPAVVAGSGAMILTGTGSLSSTFAVSASGTWGFPSGSWTITQQNGTCTGTGTWYANKQ
jgi:hypothetical protein